MGKPRQSVFANIEHDMPSHVVMVDDHREEGIELVRNFATPCGSAAVLQTGPAREALTFLTDEPSNTTSRSLAFKAPGTDESEKILQERIVLQGVVIDTV